MKAVRLSLMASLLLAAANLAQATTIYTLNIDLGIIHAGSTLSGTVTVPANLLPGDSANMSLSFSDPADYSVSSLATVLTIGNGGFGNTARFSEMTFTNLANNATIILNVNAPAQCATSAANPDGVPCTANGLWRDHDPARFTGTYTVTAALSTSSSVPEPSSSALAILGVGALAAYIKRPRRA